MLEDCCSRLHLFYTFKGRKTFNLVFAIAPKHNAGNIRKIVKKAHHNNQKAFFQVTVTVSNWVTEQTESQTFLKQEYKQRYRPHFFFKN